MNVKLSKVQEESIRHLSGAYFIPYWEETQTSSGFDGWKDLLIDFRVNSERSRHLMEAFRSIYNSELSNESIEDLFLIEYELSFSPELVGMTWREWLQESINLLQQGASMQ